MPIIPQLTLRRQCAGRCGTFIAYLLEPGQFAPALHCDDLVSYKDGHLCTACEAVVEMSLASRRTAIAAAAFICHRDPTT